MAHEVRPGLEDPHRFWRGVLVAAAIMAVGAFAVCKATQASAQEASDAVVDDDPPYGVWDRLVMCEATGDWAANTGNGFSGGLQFTAGTWRAHGGEGVAWQASRAEQIRVAEAVLADQGWIAWPYCSRRLGLR